MLLHKGHNHRTSKVVSSSQGFEHSSGCDACSQLSVHSPVWNFAGKERYGGSEFGENDLIQKKKLDIVCVRCFPRSLAMKLAPARANSVQHVCTSGCWVKSLKRENPH